MESSSALSPASVPVPWASYLSEPQRNTTGQSLHLAFVGEELAYDKGDRLRVNACRVVYRAYEFALRKGARKRNSLSLSILVYTRVPHYRMNGVSRCYSILEALEYERSNPFATTVARAPPIKSIASTISVQYAGYISANRLCLGEQTALEETHRNHRIGTENEVHTTNKCHVTFFCSQALTCLMESYHAA